MTNPMDPDRYQMKDIKRRVRKVEVLATSTASSLTRWKSRIRDLEAQMASITEGVEYLRTHTFVRAVPKELISDPTDDSEEENP